MITLEGRWKVTRVCRRTGRVLGVHRFKNTIQSAGIHRVLDCMIGASGLHMNQGNADLVIRNSSDTVVKTITGADSGYPDHSTSKQVTWRWSDISVETYEADDLLVKRDHGGSDNLTFSVSDQNLGTKPDSENWLYKYTLSIGNGGDTDLQDTGLDLILKLFSGNSALHYDNPIIEVFTPTDTSLGTVAADAGFPSRSGTTVTMEFTSEAGQETGDWDDVGVYNGPGSGNLSYVNENIGNKSSSTERKYTFEFTLS